MARQLGNYLSRSLSSLSCSSCCSRPSSSDGDQAEQDRTEPSAEQPSIELGTDQTEPQTGASEEEAAGAGSSEGQAPAGRPATSPSGEGAASRPADPDEIAGRGLKYGKFQAAGERRVRWLEDPNEPGCSIPRSTLTFDDLYDLFDGIEIQSQAKNLDVELEEQVVELGLPDEFRTPVHDSVYRYFRILHYNLSWTGHTGPGIIVIGKIRREKDAAAQISAVTQAVYQRDFDLESLKYIFMTIVVNRETSNLIMNQIYTAANGLDWPDSESQTWVPNNPEYNALLGTRLGKIILYFLLGAFDRGTRQIRQIVTWPTPGGVALNIRFDIVHVE